MCLFVLYVVPYLIHSYHYYYYYYYNHYYHYYYHHYYYYHYYYNHHYYYYYQQYYYRLKRAGIPLHKEDWILCLALPCVSVVGSEGFC